MWLEWRNRLSWAPSPLFSNVLELCTQIRSCLRCLGLSFKPTLWQSGANDYILLEPAHKYCHVSVLGWKKCFPSESSSSGCQLYFYLFCKLIESGGEEIIKTKFCVWHNPQSWCYTSQLTAKLPFSWDPVSEFVFAPVWDSSIRLTTCWMGSTWYDLGTQRIVFLLVSEPRPFRREWGKLLPRKTYFG